MCLYIAKVGASTTTVLDSCFVNFNYRFRMTLQNSDMKVKMLAVWTDSMYVSGYPRLKEHSRYT